MFLFIYDDGVHPFDDGGCATSGALSEPEGQFIRQMVNEFKAYPNLVWVVQEEYRFIKTKKADPNREPCTEARTVRMLNLAALIKKTDGHGHPVGVHHNIGLPMQFADDEAVDVYLQQSDVRNMGMNLDTLHAQGLLGFDTHNRYAYMMAECYNWHRKLLESKDRTMLRKSYYASALAGGGVLVLAMFDAKTPDPTDDMLADMRRMQQFFESIRINDLSPADTLQHGDTRWMMANSGKNHYLLYSPDNPANLGVKAMKKGSYALTWFDPETGTQKQNKQRVADGDARFVKPKGIGSEAVLYLSRQ